MSKKRNNEDGDEINSNPDPAFKKERLITRGRVTSPLVKTLQDLPTELLEHILLDAVISELIDRKIFVSAWKKSADRVVERFRSVCPHWNNVLTTDWFRSRLHEIADSYPQVEITFKLLTKCQLSNCVAVAAMNDDIFVLYHEPVNIEVYDHGDLQTMKTSIQLPGVTMPWDLVACSVSNCLYVLHQASRDIAISHISKEGQQFQVSPFITCSNELVGRMCVSGDGELILFQGPIPSKITVYNVDGTLTHQLELANTISYLHSIISKSNGNFLLVKMSSLTEIDREGNILHECKGSFHEYRYAAIDRYDRIVTVNDCDNVQLLDSEFNSTKVLFGLPCDNRSNKHFYRVCYSRQRNEFVAFENAAFCDADASQCLTVFDFRERNVPNDWKNKQN